MVTTRYSDQQGSKSRQKIMRLYKQWHRPNHTSLLHIESNLDRLGMLSPTHDQRSQQKNGKITLQPVLIKSKFLKATHCTEIRKNVIPRSMMVEAIHLYSTHAQLRKRHTQRTRRAYTYTTHTNTTYKSTYSHIPGITYTTHTNTQHIYTDIYIFIQIQVGIRKYTWKRGRIRRGCIRPSMTPRSLDPFPSQRYHHARERKRMLLSLLHARCASDVSPNHCVSNASFLCALRHGVILHASPGCQNHNADKGEK